MSKTINWKKQVENVIFNVRWLLNVFYFGLIFVLVMYSWAYVKQIMDLFTHLATASTDELKLMVLDTIDIVMIANLVKMIISGSYNSFISKSHGYQNENISSGMLKIKISTSVIVVASIHLLKSFISDTVHWELLQKDLAIYGAFIVSALALGVLEFLHIKGEKIEHDLHKETKHEEPSTSNH